MTTSDEARAVSDRSLISILGWKDVARAADVHRGSVMRWRQHGCIPTRHRLAVWALIEAEGIRIDKTDFLLGRNNPRKRGDDNGE